MRRPAFRRSLRLCCALFLAAVCLCMPVSGDTGSRGGRVLACSEVPLFLGEEFLGCGLLVDSVTYVPLLTFTELMLGQDCAADWDPETDSAVLRAEGLELSLSLGSGYMSANGRCLSLSAAYNVNGTIIVPVRTLAKVFCLGVEWDEADWAVRLDDSGLGLFASGEAFYDSDDLYWLSRVIAAEARTQPLSGMVGVGNVVLNRLNDPSGCFGKSVAEVIFQYGQFDVVRSGAIYEDPGEAATVAAKLCLEGYNTVGDSKWFVNPSIGVASWMWKNKTLQCAIADHMFFY